LESQVEHEKGWLARIGALLVLAQHLGDAGTAGCHTHMGAQALTLSRVLD